ncbi:hypothetical protein [Frankia sp. AgB32]|uniref:hypothetical protein n=1 Tax=Frankia sp. AgB32 TaxID=631119 RepID=UPI00200CE146|nr:hypothetical protein [Frankia sp. AgB32]MCK9895508.1 hypothetical protein [Frankia sp. AgB32]
MDIRRCSTGLLLTGGLSVAAVLLSSPASAATPGTDTGAVTQNAGQKSLVSATVPVCYRPGGTVPVNLGIQYPEDPVAAAPSGPTTCYELSYRYDPAATTWRPSFVSPCTLQSPGRPLASRTDESDSLDEWFQNDDKDDNWFGDKDRRFDDVIIGSVTIGIGGPTIGGTGIVGGTANTAGGTTAGFGGNTAGGTTVGGTGNTVNNSGTTINGAGGTLAPTTSTATLLPACAATDFPAATGLATGSEVPDETAATATGSDVEAATSAYSKSTPSSFAPEQPGYERGWRDGWLARGQRDGEAVASGDAGFPDGLPAETVGVTGGEGDGSSDF